MPLPNPTLSSFLTTSQFNQNTSSTNPIIAGLIAGSTFVLPAFTGTNGAAEKDPGGLFGWLTYARAYKTSPAIGTSASQYIVYNNASQLITDLNKLTGVTHSLIAFTGSGGTYGLFNQTGTTSIIPREPVGIDFMHALHFLAYGGRLIIAGTTSGIASYEGTIGNSIDILLGNTLNTAIGSFIRDKQYTVGIFPTGNKGQGTTAADFSTAFGSDIYLSGTTVPNRIFNLYGVNGGTYSVPTMQSGGIVTYTIPAISDVGGAFNFAKTNNQLFLTVGGQDRSKILNKKIQNTVEWSSSLKATLRSNRVNFYVTTNPVFLGSDLVGATGSAETVTVDERVGASLLKQTLTQEITKIGVKYLFDLNNASTRASVTAEVESLMNLYSYAISPEDTSIVCDSTNNPVDYDGTLNIDVTVKPLLGTESFVVNVSLEG